ncbi:unnamed protein product, partial [Ixodes persulcatus]
PNLLQPANRQRIPDTPGERILDVPIELPTNTGCTQQITGGSQTPPANCRHIRDVVGIWSINIRRTRQVPGTPVRWTFRRPLRLESEELAFHGSRHLLVHRAHGLGLRRVVVSTGPPIAVLGRPAPGRLYGRLVVVVLFGRFPAPLAPAAWAVSAREALGGGVRVVRAGVHLPLVVLVPLAAGVVHLPVHVPQLVRGHAQVRVALLTQRGHRPAHSGPTLAPRQASASMRPSSRRCNSSSWSPPF